MSSSADSATPTRLSTITPSLISRKLRLLGRILSYDLKTARIILSNEDMGVVVDVSLCILAKGPVRWLVDARSTVSVIGYLEQSNMPPPVSPELPAHLQLIPGLLVHAILVVDAPHVDLKLWNDTVAEMEEMSAL